MVSFRSLSEFPRGTMYDILQDAYSYDPRNKEIWDFNCMTGKKTIQKVRMQGIICTMK